MRFSLRQIEVFATTARLGNISAAAGQLAMSQSAASTALAELERRTGHPLFDRAGKRLRLNELGRTLLPQALELLDRAVELEGLLAGRAGPRSLRLGATVTIGNYIIPDIIERYRRLYPGAAISLEVANTDTIAARVASFELDVALIEGDYGDPDLLVSDWFEDELVIFCSPAHPLGAQSEWSIDDVLAQEWAVREKGSGTRQTLDRAMRDHWSRWRIGMELQHIEAIINLVEAGSMVGCVSKVALTETLATGRLKQLGVPELDLRRRLYSVVHRQKYVTASMQALLDLIRTP